MRFRKKLICVLLSAVFVAGMFVGTQPLAVTAHAQSFQYSATAIPSYKKNVTKKKKKNSDTVGWLYVPNTTINTAIVQNPNEEGNEYYLHHNFKKEESKFGTYCADRRCKFGTGARTDLSFNTVLYAHNFTDDPDGILFSQLKKI